MGEQGVFKAIRAKNVVALDEALGQRNRAKNASAQGQLERSALIEAISTNKFELVELLIEAGANVNAVDCYGQSALHFATKLGDALSVKALIAAGADVNATTQKGAKPLRLALSSRSIEALAALVEAGADTEGFDSKGSSIMEIGRERLALAKEAGGDPREGKRQEQFARAVIALAEACEIKAEIKSKMTSSRSPSLSI